MLGVPTVSPVTLDLTGVGLAAGDVVTEQPDMFGVRFSSTVDDGAGGIKVNMTADGGATGPFDLVVTDASDGSTATCSGCLHLGRVPSSPLMSRIDPGDGTLHLQWYASNPGSAPIDHYEVSWSDNSGPLDTVDVTSASADIDGLSNGIDYTFDVTAVSSWGKGVSTEFVERVGTAPDAPLITGFTPEVFGARLRVVNGSVWTLTHELTWDIRGTAPDGVPFEDDLG